MLLCSLQGEDANRMYITYSMHVLISAHTNVKKAVVGTR